MNTDKNVFIGAKERPVSFNNYALRQLEQNAGAPYLDILQRIENQSLSDMEAIIHAGIAGGMFDHDEKQIVKLNDVRVWLDKMKPFESRKIYEKVIMIMTADILGDEVAEQINEITEKETEPTEQKN